MVVTLRNPRRATKNGKHQKKKWITKMMRLALYLRDGFRCGYCLADLHGADPRDLTIDHVKPKMDGGTDDPKNLITCCRTCNCKKQSLPVNIFAGPETVKMIRTFQRRSMAKYLKLAKFLMEGEPREE